MSRLRVAPRGTWTCGRCAAARASPRRSSALRTPPFAPTSPRAFRQFPLAAPPLTPVASLPIIASTKPKSSPKKPTPASSKAASKAAKAAPKAAKAPRGEDLVASVLASKGIALKTADAESPSFPTPTLFLEAERVIAAYRKARAAFVKVPTFEQDLADAGRGLLEHAMVVDNTWQKARFAKKKGESRGRCAKRARRSARRS